MKRPPHMEKIEALMRSDDLVAGGFLGGDHRTLEEIIEDDKAELERCGVTAETLAEKMALVSARAAEGLGCYVAINEHLSARCDDNRGLLVCPWGDNVRRYKTVTTAVQTDSRLQLQWSDLSIHLVGAHGFFEGRGSVFRLEPRELCELLSVIELPEG